MPTRRPRTERPGRKGSWSSDVLPRGRLPIDFGTVEFVLDPHEPGAVLVLLNGVESSHLNTEHPEQLMFEYMQWMAATIDRYDPRPAAVTALHLGAAGCAMAAHLEATRPNSRQIAIDADAELVRLVRSALPLPRSPRLRIRVGDARAQVATFAPGRFDVIIADVFAAETTPRHLRTVEFVAEVRPLLRPGGLLLVNTISRPNLDAVRADAAAVADVFDEVLVISEPAVLRGRRFGNVVVVAAADGPGGRLVERERDLDRALRQCSPPASLVAVDEVPAFIGHVLPRRDP